MTWVHYQLTQMPVHLHVSSGASLPMNTMVYSSLLVTYPPVDRYGQFDCSVTDIGRSGKGSPCHRCGGAWQHTMYTEMSSHGAAWQHTLYTEMSSHGAAWQHTLYTEMSSHVGVWHTLYTEMSSHGGVWYTLYTEISSDLTTYIVHRNI